MIKFIVRRKLISIAGLLIIIGASFGFQSLNKDEGETQYVTAAVERSTLITSVEGSGQVSVSDQVDISSKVSGDITYVGMKKGQEVRTGAFLLQTDSSDAQKAVRNAETDLETAKLELSKLLEPSDELDLLKAENNLAKAKESKQQAEDNIVEGYEDAFNVVTDVFLDLPTIVTAIRDVLYSYEIGESEATVSDYDWNISVYQNSFLTEDRYMLDPLLEDAEDDYRMARENYDQSFENYKKASRYSGEEEIESLLDETIETTRLIAEAIKSGINLLDFVVGYFSDYNRNVYGKITEYQSDLKSYTSQTNSHLSSLLSVQRSFQDNRKSVLDAERSIGELELSLADLKAGADELDIRAKEIAVRQKEDALLDAQQDLANHYIYASFSGIIAEVSVKKGESISSGSVVATLVTKQQLAEITLNEVDIAQIEVGQKATAVFDVIDDFTITGEVAEVDTLGEVSQGVVTYDAKIVFDTQDERIRPGMSVSVAIITNVRQGILTVPNTAIKYQGDIQYVEVMLEDKTIAYRQVEIGISNDTRTEIVSGLEEGEEVVSGQITSSSVSNNSGNSGGPGGGMNMMRMF